MSPMRPAHWVCYSWLLLGIGTGVSFIGCGKPTPNKSVGQELAPAKEVAVVRTRIESWPLTISIQGSMLAFEDSVVGSKLAGRVQEIPVDLGSVVRKGDVLMKLVRSELDLRVELAEAQLKQACATIGITPSADETTFDATTAPGVAMERALVNEAERTVNRARQLLSSRAVTEQEFDTMVAQLQAAEARYNSALNLVGEQISLISVRRKELALAEQAVKDSEVVAPFDGVVGERMVSPGEFVGVGQAVVTLVRSDPLRFTAGVPESRAAEIQVGQKVDIKQGLNIPRPISTTISRVSPTVIQVTRSVLIEADVPNETLELQAGLFAEAEVVVDPEARAIVLPLSTVSRFAGVQKVWLVVDGVARQLTIRTGREADHRIEIVEGLSEGAVVVLDADEGHDGPVIPRERYTEAVPLEDASRAPTSAVGGEVTGSADAIDKT